MKTELASQAGFDAWVKKVRGDFPFFADSNLVYFDNAATTLRPRAIQEAKSSLYGNINRSSNQLARKTTEAFEKVRTQIKDFLHAKDSEEIIFTSGTTGGINMIATILGRSTLLNSGDEILISEIEHHSNILPWHLLEKEKGLKVKTFKVRNDGYFDFNDFQEKVTSKVKLIAVTMASNVLGQVIDLKPYVKLAHERGALILVDGAQIVSHRRLNLIDLDCDFFVFSAHKSCGPTGLGICYGKSALLQELPPYQVGGGMVREIRGGDSEFESIPLKFEAGTPNISGVIELGEALSYLDRIGWEQIRKHEERLKRELINTIQDFPWLQIAGDRHLERIPLISFYSNKVASLDIEVILDQQGILTRSGYLCSSPLFHALNIPRVIRVSAMFYNSIEEIKLLREALKTVEKIFRL